MAKLSKRMRAIAEKVDAEKAYSIEEAVGLLNELSKAKFKESFDVSINLGVDPRKSDQVVRGQHDPTAPGNQSAWRYLKR